MGQLSRVTSIEILCRLSTVSNALAFSSTGGQLASGSSDSTARIWDPLIGTPMHTLTGHTRSVVNVAFAPSDNLFASGSYDGTIRPWDLRSGNVVWVIKDNFNASPSLLFSPDGQFLVTASHYTTGRMWDLRAKQLFRKLSGVSEWWENKIAYPRLAGTNLFHLDDTRRWIVKGAQKILYLPVERQGDLFASGDNWFALGHRIGTVTILHFNAGAL